MEIAKIKVSGATASAEKESKITAGMVGVTVRMQYADIWDGLHKTVVFRAGTVTKDVITDDEVVTVPKEVVATKDVQLYVGVYGVDAEGNLVIPTIWAGLGRVMDAADPSGDDETDASLPAWVKIMTDAENAVAVAQSVRDDADRGAFDGPQGPQGPQGQAGADGAPGKDGASATHSWNGTVLTITSASGTSSADLKGEKGDTGATGPQGPQGEKGDTGPQGPQGPAGNDGYTPVKGVDYFDGATGDKGDKGEPGDAGLSVYFTTEDNTLDDVPFTPSNIQTSGRTIINGDLLLTPNGRLYRVYSVSSGIVDALYVTTLKGDKGD